jgi:hypothetical protein
MLRSFAEKQQYGKYLGQADTDLPFTQPSDKAQVSARLRSSDLADQPNLI